MEHERVQICNLAERQCIPMDFLEIKNKSTYWCGLLLIMALFGILLTCYLITGENVFWLKVALTAGFILVGIWMIKSMFATDRVFQRLVPVNF